MVDQEAGDLLISNRDLRQMWLGANGLVRTPTGPVDVLNIVRNLGFLQLDAIRNVTRAHHHIVWSRNQNYREHMLWPLLKKRQLFEHYTHDASLIPMEWFDLWQQQFARLGRQTSDNPWYNNGLSEQDISAIWQRIRDEGPLSTKAFETRSDSDRMWARPPHKKALDQMWYAGILATSHRENFLKFYDIAERVFPYVPGKISVGRLNETQQADRLCDLALERLWIATPGEIQRFWDAVDLATVRDWVTQRRLRPVRIQRSDGTWHTSYASPLLEKYLESCPKPSSRLRIINPFDPAVRDRQRLRHVFGFEYRNEMFVPAAKRRWGYYVYPLLEGDRFVGRIELTADRSARILHVKNLWCEDDVRLTAARETKLRSELSRMARFIGAETVDADVIER